MLAGDRRWPRNAFVDSRLLHYVYTTIAKGNYQATAARNSEGSRSGSCSLPSETHSALLEVRTSA